MPRLGWTGDQIADRITLALPEKFAREHTTNVWKFLRSIAEVFKVNTDGVDELFTQTNIVSATGDFLNDYIVDLTEIVRKPSEVDNDYRARFYRNVLVYNGTKNGMKQIVFDVLGYVPYALVTKERGGFFDALNFYNDLEGGSHYGWPDGGAYVGFIYLLSAPTSAQLDELCSLIVKHKALGVKIYIKYRKYDVFRGYTYQQITVAVTDQPQVKVIGPAAYGDFYDALSFYNDKNYPAIYGLDDETSLNHKYLYLTAKPETGQLDELLESLSENLVGGDSLYVVYPTGDFETTPTT